MGREGGGGERAEAQHDALRFCAEGWMWRGESKMDSDLSQV